MTPRGRRGSPLSRLFVWAGLVLGGVVFAGPLLFLVAGALKPGELVLSESGSWRAFWPTNASFDNLVEAWDTARMPILFWNTAVVAVASVLLGLTVNSLVGYALARFQFKGRRALLLIVIALVIVPFQAIVIPTLLMMANWGLRNTYAGLILPGIASPFFIYLFYSFFLSTPKELEEAALVDGAGPLRVFLSIAVPLAKPAFATAAILTFMSAWGELLWPALITDDITVRTIQLGISFMSRGFGVDQGVVLASVLLASIPVLIMFAAMQRQVIETAARSGIR